MINLQNIGIGALVGGAVAYFTKATNPVIGAAAGGVLGQIFGPAAAPVPTEGDLLAADPGVAGVMPEVGAAPRDPLAGLGLTGWDKFNAAVMAGQTGRAMRAEAAATAAESADVVDNYTSPSERGQQVGRTQRGG
jgi:hypothetical protein